MDGARAGAGDVERDDPIDQFDADGAGAGFDGDGRVTDGEADFAIRIDAGWQVGQGGGASSSVNIPSVRSTFTRRIGLTTVKFLVKNEETSSPRDALLEGETAQYRFSSRTRRVWGRV